MRNDLTEIVLVVDRSGSMRSTQSDAEGGINSFIAEQKKAAGNARFTLIEFNTRRNAVYDGADIQSVGDYRMTPAGDTALLDAVGYAIDTTGERLARLSEADRPGLVVFVIVTDGQENASREYTRAAVRERIEHQQSKYSWKFVFLGSDLSTYGEAGSMGVRLGSTARYAARNTAMAYNTASANLASCRSASFSGQAIGSDALDFSEAQLSSLNTDATTGTVSSSS